MTSAEDETHAPCLTLTRDEWARTLAEAAKQRLTLGEFVTRCILRTLELADRPPRGYADQRFCDHCNDYTCHDCTDYGHERDCSSDRQECRVCRWWQKGGTGPYHPPVEEDS